MPITPRGDSEEIAPMVLLDYWSNVAGPKPCSNVAGSTVEDLEATAEDVFHAYVPLVFNVARRVLGNESDAEDVTQEVLLRVLHKLDGFRGEGRLASWLNRVTINEALQYRRKHHRRRERQLDVSSVHLPSAGRVCGPPKDNVCPSQKLLDNELRELIERSIASLPEIYREVYVLADVEGLSNPEIGAILGLGVQAVKSRLHRARLMMREALAFYF
jgi:RNA polymerase sigma-70 factor (ECF subfamily)